MRQQCDRVQSYRTDDNVKKQTTINIVVRAESFLPLEISVRCWISGAVLRNHGFFDEHAVPGTRASSGRQRGTGEDRLPHAGPSVSSRCQCGDETAENASKRSTALTRHWPIRRRGRPMIALWCAGKVRAGGVGKLSADRHGDFRADGWHDLVCRLVGSAQWGASGSAIANARRRDTSADARAPAGSALRQGGRRRHRGEPRPPLQRRVGAEDRAGAPTKIRASVLH